MAKRKKKEHDFSVTAFRVIQEATGLTEQEAEQESPPLTEDGKNPNAATLGWLGGLKGGNARASKLTPARRKEIVRKAAEIRWGKKPQT